MKKYTGPMDGVPFTAEKPVIAIGWPQAESITQFDSRQEAWNFVRTWGRTDKFALLARLYEFKEGAWERFPSIPNDLKERDPVLESTS